MNKALIIRSKLGLSQREAGMYLLGIKGKKYAENAWYRLETDHSASCGTDQLLNFIYMMVIWRDTGKKGCSKTIGELVKLAEKGEFT